MSSNPSIVGSWYETTSSHSEVVTFLSNGQFYVDYDVNSSSSLSGLEFGHYTWDSSTGAFSATDSVNTNGFPGLANISSLSATATTLQLGSQQLTNIPESNHSIIGSWYYQNTGQIKGSGVITFLANGQVYFNEISADNGKSNAGGQNGIEVGTYTWNSSTGKFTDSEILDTNGEWGLFKNGMSKNIPHITISGQTATITQIVSGGVKTVLATRVVPVAPSISTVDYDAASGKLSLTGSNLDTTVGSYKLSAFTLSGDGGANYSLSSGSKIIPASLDGNHLNIQLSPADQLAIGGLLNNAGTTANDKTPYNLSLASGWDTGAAKIPTEVVNVSHVTAPAIFQVKYNAVSGVFTFIGTDLVKHAKANDITVGDFTLSADTGSYTFNNHDKIGSFSAHEFTVTLSGADQKLVNAIANDNGSFSANGVAYNLTATNSGWDSDSGSAFSKQTLTVTGAGKVHPVYLLDTPLAIETPVSISGLSENTHQIQLSKSIFTAFSAESALSSADFSSIANIHSITSLFYDSHNGELYYVAPGATAPVEIAVVGVGSHPAALSLGDFNLVA